MEKEQAISLDQFYTKKSVAKHLFSKTKQVLSKYVLLDKCFWVEPSAGTGVFLDLLPEESRMGIDIDPKRNNIIKSDFLKYEVPKRNNIIIGNPPFGKRSKMAIAFFNHASKFTQWIAFIVPFQFKKYSVHSKLNKSFKLIYQQDLEKNSFIFKDKDYGIRCCFQIWTSVETKTENLRIVQRPPTKHQDFALFQYNNTKVAQKYFNKKKYSWDFAVHRQGFYDYSKKIKKEKDLNKNRQYIFIKLIADWSKEIFKKLDFSKLSAKNTIIPGFGKADLIREYTDIRRKSGE